MKIFASLENPYVPLISMHPAIPIERRADVITIAILGTDVMMAALPATPIQLAHACLHAGYALAVPASWGDELVAAECIRQLADRGPRPAVMCACPHVRQELLAGGPDLGLLLLPLVAPPIAVARYLHALYGRDRVHLTYLGACPAGGDEAIDQHCGPADFLAWLAGAGISLTDEPKVFDSVIPPDRRRYFSVAGGLPSAEQLWTGGNGRSLVELDGEDYLVDLAQHLLSHECSLIDLAPRLGCACSGASQSVPARSARAAVAVVEPPRASSAVVDVAIAIDLVEPIVVDTKTQPDRTGHVLSVPDRRGTRNDPDSGGVVERSLAASGPPAVTKARRSSPAAGVRSIRNEMPTASVGGRSLPRAYMAKRRSSDSPRPVASHGERVGSRIPPPNAPEPIGEDNGRSRAPARVASASRSRQQTESPASIAAAAAGTSEMMGDGPRS